MRVLSLTQPWATLVVIGAKKIETRGWNWLPTYRGPLIIHAAKSFPADCRRLCGTEPFKSALAAVGHFLPTAVAVGIVDLVDAYRFTERPETVPEPERCFGDFTPGRIGLRLETPRRYQSPAPMRGALGLFKPPEFFEPGPLACACCAAGDIYNGFGSDGPTFFTCPSSCPCHD